MRDGTTHTVGSGSRRYIVVDGYSYDTGTPWQFGYLSDWYPIATEPVPEGLMADRPSPMEWAQRLTGSQIEDAVTSVINNCSGSYDSGYTMPQEGALYFNLTMKDGSRHTVGFSQTHLIIDGIPYRADAHWLKGVIETWTSAAPG